MPLVYDIEGNSLQTLCDQLKLEDKRDVCKIVANICQERNQEK